MSTFAELIRQPSSLKITLLELDIGRMHGQWFNRRAGVWYYNFSGTYALIDAAFLAGVVGLDIARVGSVKSDGIPLAAVTGLDAVQTNELSFWWDSANLGLYVHIQNGDEPSIHQMFYGEAIGVANVPCDYNGFHYQPRLRSVPSIRKSKDPVFFGKIAFEGGRVAIENGDGYFDTFGEDNDLFGNAARILVGFEGLAYADFLPAFSGYIEDIEIGPDTMEVTIADKRKYLARKVPDTALEQTTYPNLADGNIGKVKPLAYGVIRRAPAICLNEEENPAPATYTFLLADTDRHPLHAITTVYVDDVVTVPASTDLTAGTFTLAAADYTPGQAVLADFEGYEDDGGALIANALDVARDLLVAYFPMNYNELFFNTGEWNLARARSPDIAYFGREPVEVIQIIEQISSSVFGNFIVQDDGRYTYRLYNEFAASLQTIPKEELLEGPPRLRYATQEVLSSTRIGYARDWGNDEYLYLADTSQKDAIYERYRVLREGKFDTLLPDAVAAQSFSDKVLQLSGWVQRFFETRTKLQPIQREIGDLVTVDLNRPSGTGLGWVVAEVMGVEKNLTAFEVILTCRIVERVHETVYEQGEYYGDGYYGDGLYSDTQYREAS